MAGEFPLPFVPLYVPFCLPLALLSMMDRSGGLLTATISQKSSHALSEWK